PHLFDKGLETRLPAQRIEHRIYLDQTDLVAFPVDVALLKRLQRPFLVAKAKIEKTPPEYIYVSMLLHFVQGRERLSCFVRPPHDRGQLSGQRDRFRSVTDNACLGI